MKKVFKSNAELSHVWANQLQSEGRASNMFFEGNTIYSYGHHYQIAQIITAPNNQKVCFINSNGYSNSTAKHTNLVINAIPDGIFVYSVPFVNYNKFSINYLPAIVESLKKEIQDKIDQQLKAKSQFYYFNDANLKFYNLQEICRLFNLDEPQRPEKWEDARIKSEKIRETQKVREQERENKELAKNLELLEKWKKHEYNGTLFNIPVHLRFSPDKKHIQTSKGANVETCEAIKLLKLLKSGSDVKGYQINGFTVIENSPEFVKIGCHLIKWEAINSFFGSVN